MDRRTFIARAAFGLVVAPRVAAAQQGGRVYRIGTLSSGAKTTDAEFSRWDWVLALRELGWIEGRNVVFERRIAERRPDLLPGLARELVAAKVDVIATFFGSDHSAAKQATSLIPIVMIYNGLDAVADGIVASYARPGGNVTGISRQLGESDAKRLQLIREALPLVRRIGVLAGFAYPDQRAKFADRMRDAAREVRVDVEFFWYATQDDVDAAFPAMQSKGIEAFLLEPQPFTFQNRRRVAEIAIKHRLPGVFTLREYTEAGGLMSYGPDWTQLLKQHARYVDRILRGAPPADLPIEQPNKFELLINQRTAASLELRVPQSLLSRADAIIQ